MKIIDIVFRVALIGALIWIAVEIRGIQTAVYYTGNMIDRVADCVAPIQYALPQH